MLIKELLSEGRAQEIVHKNPTGGTLKAFSNEQLLKQSLTESFADSKGSDRPGNSQPRGIPNNAIIEQEDDMPDMQRRLAQRREINGLIKHIQQREQSKKRYHSHRTYANMEYELERNVRDGDDDLIYIMVNIEISGEYSKGYKGSRYDPPEPATYNDIAVESLKTQDLNPEGGPLTMSEKIKIEKWVDNEDGQQYAIDALLEASSDY